jgi:hypothetical protein
MASHVSRCRALQNRVRSYPSSTQTPDFGTFELDDRGDIVLPTLADRAVTDAGPRASEAATAHPAVSASATMGRSRPRARIGMRVAIGVAVGALAAVLALIIASGGDRGQPGTAPVPSDGGGSGKMRGTAAVPIESPPAAHIGAPNIVNAAQRAT